MKSWAWLVGLLGWTAPVPKGGQPHYTKDLEEKRPRLLQETDEGFLPLETPCASHVIVWCPLVYKRRTDTWEWEEEDQHEEGTTQADSKTRLGKEGDLLRVRIFPSPTLSQNLPVPHSGDLPVSQTMKKPSIQTCRSSVVSLRAS